MNTKKPLVGSKYMPKYYGNYFDRPWYEKDLTEYFDYYEYSEMAKDPNNYFMQKRVVNFDIIHHEWREEPLQGSYKDCNTVYSKDIKEYPENGKKFDVWFLMLEVWLEILIEIFICRKKGC